MAGSIGVETLGESAAFRGDDWGELKLIVVVGVLGVGLVQLDAVLHGWVREIGYWLFVSNLNFINCYYYLRSLDGF